MDYEAVYLPKNHFIKEESMATEDYLALFYPFDKPDVVNESKSPCAASVPVTVFGHTGFTGTCAWVDPDNGLIYVFLSNRTYPDAWVNKLSKLEIREKIQETIYEAMKEK